MNRTACLALILAPCLATAAPSGAAADTFEVVQLARIDPPANPLRALRDQAYKACADKASALDLPVLPFPALPARREERITTITNGFSSIVKRVTVEVKYAMPLDPKGGCKVEMANAPVTITVITHGADVTTRRSDSAAVTRTAREHEPPSDLNLQQMDTSGADYTVARSVNGVALRCLRADSPQLLHNRFMNAVERCVYAEARALYFDVQPMVLYSHVQLSLVTPDYAYNYIIEPVSVRKLPKEQADPFAAALR